MDAPHSRQPSTNEGERTASHELPVSGMEREDKRWRLRNQLRDWGLLLAMIALYLLWTGIVYFLEPGIR